jgi:hypothetical protein
MAIAISSGPSSPINIRRQVDTFAALDMNDPYYATNRQWLKNEFKVFGIGAVPLPGAEDVKEFAGEAEKIFTLT